MKQSSQDQLQKLTPLLRIVKTREQIYLQLMQFVTKNIQSTSSQHEQLSLFTKFLQSIKCEQKQISQQQNQMISYFETSCSDQYLLVQNTSIVTHVTKNNKQILRLCSRLIEILDASISKTRKSIFNQNGRVSLDFTRFKRNLHNIVKGQNVHLGQFTNHILNYCRIKYKKQIAKVQKYMFKLQSGAMIALRDLYFKQKSDVSSPDQRQQQTYRNNLMQSVKKIQHNSSTQSPRRSLKKPILKSTKKVHKLLKSSKGEVIETKQPKQSTATKLYKFYGMMDLSKKQFLEDYIYQRNTQEQHRKKIFNSLIQRNKTIGAQINTYFKKSLTYQQKIKQIHINNYVQSSGEEKEKSKDKNSSGEKGPAMLKNTSLRKSFVISKRKSSLNFEKTSKILTQHDDSSKVDSKTIRNFPVRRKSSAESSQHPKNASKKLFVIKPPVMFQDDNIPQAPNINTGGWFRAPMTTRKTQKKGDNIRLKRRNNPLPMQKSLFNDNFKFSEL